MNFNIYKALFGTLTVCHFVTTSCHSLKADSLELESFNPTYLTYSKESESNTRELRVQLSFKTTLMDKIKVGYNQRFRWEIYESSAPIDDIDFNPSVFFESSNFDAGYEHESNGLDEEKSRSWERFFLIGKYKHDLFFLKLKAWSPFFIHENNGIVEYQGKGEVVAGIDADKLKVSTTLRMKNTKVEVSYDLGDFYVYAQIFNGFGPQIIEFDKENNLAMIGIALTK